MADLVVIVPSRGRPEATRALAQHFKMTCTADTLLNVVVDSDDPRRDEYDVHGLTIGTNGSMVEALNSASFGFASLGRGLAPFAIGFMGDDHLPRTHGWDARYLEALRELGTGIVYGNDLLQGHRLPTQCAMTADIVRALGYMSPPTLRHLFVDNTWLQWGKNLDRIRYLSDVIVEHRHPVAGKAQWDDNYLRVNSSEVTEHDRAAFDAYCRDRLDADLAKVRAVMAVSA